MNNYRSYNHALVKNNNVCFQDVKIWLQDNIDGGWVFEPHDIPTTIVDYASVYIKNNKDFFIFKLRWNTEK